MQATAPRALADLPAFAGTVPDMPKQSPRVAIERKHSEQLARTNRLLRETLAEVLKLAGRNALTPADDELIVRATRVLKVGGLLA